MNLDRLHQIFSNDKKMVAQFLGIFKSEIPSQLSKLEKAIKDKDKESISIIAHSIKSQVKYLDLQKIAKKALSIEEGIEQLDDLNDTFQEMKEELLEVLEDLD